MPLALPSFDSVLDIACEAGTLVLALQDEIVRTPSKRHVKADGSFVTPADIQSLEFIVRRLRALAPEIPIVAEEQAPDVNQTILSEPRLCWLVDSLDNTRDYALGGMNFSINIALVDAAGVPLMGVLVFPQLQEAYFTDNDGRAYLREEGGEPVALQALSFANTASAATVAVAQSPGRAPMLHASAGKRLQFITSRGQRRACLVARGLAALCVEHEGFYLWDTAPIAAILRAAGGEIFNLETSEPLAFHSHLRLPAYAAVASRALFEKIQHAGDPMTLPAYGRHQA